MMLREKIIQMNFTLASNQKLLLDHLKNESLFKIALFILEMIISAKCKFQNLWLISVKLEMSRAFIPVKLNAILFAFLIFKNFLNSHERCLTMMKPA